MFRLMFSIVTVASSTRIPTASASPLRVITLSVCPRAARQMIEHSTASGMEVAMISVLRQLPRKRRIMSAVRQAAMVASRMTPEIEARTNSDWSTSTCTSREGGSAGLSAASSTFTRLTTARVDAFPFLSTVM